MKRIYNVILVVSLFAVVATLVLAQDSSLEANIELVKGFQAAVNAQNLAEFDNLVAPDIVDHNPGPGQEQSLEGFKKSFEPFFAAFSDLEVGLAADFIAEGDKVVVRHYFTGTQNGPFGDIQPTGRKVMSMALDTWRVKDGKLAEVWHFEELLQVVGQLTSPEPMTMPEQPAMMTPSMGTGDPEANKAIAQHFYDVFNSRTFDEYDSFIPADTIDHNPVPDQKPGLVGLKEALQGFVAVFPDMQITIEDVTAEGDLVSIHGVAKGTHEGEFLGVPSTGKQVSFGFSDLYRIKDGKIVETWHAEELLQTLGFLTAQ